jgi:hypothetical protein
MFADWSEILLAPWSKNVTTVLFVYFVFRFDAVPYVCMIALDGGPAMTAYGSLDPINKKS